MFRTTIFSMSEQNEKNLINFIATTIEGMRYRVDNHMATKEGLAALKEQMVTKRELATLKDLVTTKADISRVEANLVALREPMATKNDVARVEASMDTQTTAIRGDIGQVQVRLDLIDRANCTSGTDRYRN